MRVLVTGASGCIGHYLSERLIRETAHELFLLVRDPSRLHVDLSSRPGVHVVTGDLSKRDAFQDILGQAEALVHVAAVWGGPEAEAINHHATLELVRRLDPDACRVVQVFSTASVLARDGTFLSEAESLGTPYIRSKARAARALPALPLAERTTVLYPTLVLGGGGGRPVSHFSNLVREVARWGWLARFFSADGSFQWIHAEDIARVSVDLLEHPPDGPGPHHVVLGGAPVTANAALAALAESQGRRVHPWIPVSFPLAELLIRVFRIQMAAWDRYCMRQRHFIYDGAVTPADYGLPVFCPTLREGL